MTSKVELADLPTMDREIRERAFSYRTRSGGRRRSHTGSIVGGGGGGGSTPDTILAGIMTQWVRGDLGITMATGVSAWADQSGNGHNFAQGTGGAQPAYTASDATLNNQATLTGDGVDDRLINSTVANGLGTWVWGIVKIITWGNAKFFWGSNDPPESGDFYMATSTPQCALYNGNLGTNLNGGLTVGSWGRVEMHFVDSIACYLKLRSTTVTGASAGGTSSTGANLFAVGGTGYSHTAIAERIVCSSLPSAGQRSALDAYCTARYGAGLV